MVSLHDEFSSIIIFPLISKSKGYLRILKQSLLKL